MKKNRLSSWAIVICFLVVCCMLMYFYVGRSKQSLIAIYGVLNPGMSAEDVRAVYTEKKTLFMTLREFDSNSWIVVDHPVWAVSREARALWLEFTNNTLHAVRIRSLVPFDRKTPISSYPDKIVKAKMTASPGPHPRNQQLSDEKPHNDVEPL